MNIDRSNYEIWLIDWLDGNLSDLQTEQIKQFLFKNPDLNEEFEELTTFSLKPSMKSFPRKELLKKSTEELPLSQFEYLCVAYLEKDLPPSQQTQLKECIDQDSEKLRIFDLIQKTKLAPSNIRYKNKNHLIKSIETQKIIRFLVIGLSAAATIALIIMSNLIIPQKLPDKINNITQNIVVDSNYLKPADNILSVKLLTDKNPDLAEQKPKNPDTTVLNVPSEISEPFNNMPIQIDSLVRNPEIPGIHIAMIPFSAEFNLKGVHVNNTLVSSSSPIIIPPSYDKSSRLNMFIAKTFRERILKEPKSKGNMPLKGYEIAEAGITGLNKLLGWNMSLNENNDKNGELRSVYFSSKILKFNAPVKKSLPLL